VPEALCAFATQDFLNTAASVLSAIPFIARSIAAVLSNCLHLVIQVALLIARVLP
jgi:hypothetical protein